MSILPPQLILSHKTLRIQRSQWRKKIDAAEQRSVRVERSRLEYAFNILYFKPGSTYNDDIELKVPFYGIIVHKRQGTDGHEGGSVWGGAGHEYSKFNNKGHRIITHNTPTQASKILLTR